MKRLGSVFLALCFSAVASPLFSQTQALSFAGAEDTVELQSEIVLDGEFTVEYWLRSTNFESIYSVVSSSSSDSYSIRHDSYEWLRLSGSVSDEMASGLVFLDPVVKTAQDNVSFYVKRNLEDGNWFHIAAARDSSNSLKVYLNGELMDKAATRLGTNRFDRIGSGLTGQVADLRIWARARSMEEIERDRFRRLLGDEDDLLGYWPLNEVSGGVAHDITAAANHGALAGAVPAPADGLTLVANDSAFIPSAPVVLADPVTGSVDFTNTNRVRVADFAIPPGADLYQVTDSPAPASISPSGWVSVGDPPEEVEFAAPAADADAVVYFWFSESSSPAAPPRRAAAAIRFTAAIPRVSARATLELDTAGYSVRVLPSEIDNGSDGGESGGRDIPVHSAELVDYAGESADLTPGEPFRTLPAIPGDYGMRLRVMNAAGNVAVSDVCLITLNSAGMLPQGERYVAIGNDGAAYPFSSWATAAAEIQDAVDAASPGDSVIIARGVYHGSGTGIVSVLKPVRLIGAHAREEVVLDGGDGAFGDRRHGIIAKLAAVADGGLALEIANLTITRCFTRSSSGYAGTGAGITIDHSGLVAGYAEIKNCMVSNNRQIHAHSQGATLGAGIHSAGAAGSEFELSIRDCDIVDNFSIGARNSGAGLYHANGRINMTRVNIEGNILKSHRDRNNHAGHWPPFGGGMYISGATPDSRISFCRVVNNEAAYAIGIMGNPEGGGVYFGENPMLVENTVFRGNKGGLMGGHVRILKSDGYFMFRNCLFADGESIYGGGLMLGTSSSTSPTADAILDNCTIVANKASSSGGGMYSYARNATLLRNTIVRDNSPAASAGSAVIYENCCLWTTRAGNINEDPLFADPGSGDYRLQLKSPCRDAGENLDWMTTQSRDLAGKPRLDQSSGIVDIGAYEVHPPGTVILVR